MSVTASPKSVTTSASSTPPKKVTITAVYNDPDDQLKHVAFSNSVPLTPGLGTNAKDFTAVKSGTRRTFSWTFGEDYNSKPGAQARVRRGPGRATARTSRARPAARTYTVKNKPLLTLRGSRSISYIWGTKARLVGSLTSTPSNAKRTIKIQFDKKGKQKGKQWKTRQTLKTDASGNFQTKKFKISTAGTWRASYGGSTYILSAKGTFKVKKP